MNEQLYYRLILSIIELAIMVGIPIAITFIIIIIRNFYYKEKQKNQSSIIPPPMPTQAPITGQRAPVIQQYERQTPYQGKYVLTDHEKSFYYKALKPVADEMGLIALCQVNLAAIIGIQYRAENYMSWFGKIKSKRLDFVLCNTEFFPVLVIELDDSSHDRPDRIERDQQVNLYLYEANIKILHFRAWTPEQVRQVITDTIKPPIAM